MTGQRRTGQGQMRPVKASLWLGLLWLATTFGIAPASAGRHAALVVDGNTGKVISEAAADEPRFPASLTKMMTLYVVFDLIEQGRLTYATRITFSEAATRVQPTKLGVPEGGSITVLEAIKALITKSANDASVALGEHIAGSEPKFAALMTQTARRIGMASTTFMNAHGLPNPQQVTTARDMVTLGLRLQDDFPKHYPLFSTREFTYQGSSHRNHNTMLLSYEGTDGIKTGYIGSSGFNLVANVRRNDKHVIGVVFGGPSAAVRNQTMRNLLNIAMVRASTVKTRKSIPIARGKSVPAPTAVARPAPPQAPPAPTIAATTIAPAPRNIEPLRPQVVTVATAQPNLPIVEVARVRPLLVAPSQPRQAAVPKSAAPPAEPETLSLPALAQTAAPVAPAAQPRPTQVAAAGLGPTPAFRLNGPNTASTSGGPIHIQVGAYATKADADKQLASVKAALPQVLGPYASQAIAATTGGKSVFRARFVGFDGATAGNVCNELRRRQIDCMVTKAE
jgi:D-alanyl-D-alanine carboxypeptidase